MFAGKIENLPILHDLTILFWLGLENELIKNSSDSLIKEKYEISFQNSCITLLW